MPLVYFISGSKYEAPDNETIYLINALKERGLKSSVEAWDNPKVDWGKADLCIHRNSPYVLARARDNHRLACRSRYP